MKSKIHFNLSEVQKDISKLYEEGITRGYYMGFENLHEFFSFKPIGTTYIYGAAFSGKTEWWFDELMYFSQYYGWKHAIYSPESGSAPEIFAELISKYLQKPFYKNTKGHMTESERFTAEAFIREYFYIIDPDDKDLSIKDFYSTVSQIEQEYDIKINTTCCDPFNEFDHSGMKEHGTRQDLYLENILGFVRRDANKNKRHNVIITHCTDQETTLNKEANKRYYALPLPREISGGQAWYRKAMNLICLWRPPDWLKDENGIPFKENEVHIVIYKYKPKGVGKRGMAKLYYDFEKSRYYEIYEGERRYSGKQMQRPFEQQIEYKF